MTPLDRLLRRSALLTGTGSVVLAMFVLAPYFAGELGWLGLPDPTVHLLGHIVVYGAIALSLSAAWPGRHFLCWALALIIGAGEELHQAWVPGRYADARDFAVNAASITAVILAVAAIQWTARRKPSLALAPIES